MVDDPDSAAVSHDFIYIDKAVLRVMEVRGCTLGLAEDQLLSGFRGIGTGGALPAYLRIPATPDRKGKLRPLASDDWRGARFSVSTAQENTANGKPRAGELVLRGEGLSLHGVLIRKDDFNHWLGLQVFVRPGLVAIVETEEEAPDNWLSWTEAFELLGDATPEGVRLGIIRKILSGGSVPTQIVTEHFEIPLVPNVWTTAIIARDLQSRWGIHLKDYGRRGAADFEVDAGAFRYCLKEADGTGTIPASEAMGTVEANAGTKSEIDRRWTVANSNGAPPNRRGRDPRKKREAIEAMKEAVNVGTITVERLRTMKEKELPTLYSDAGRTLLRDARREALKCLSSADDPDRFAT